MRDPRDPANIGAVDQHGNPIPGLAAYEAVHGPIGETAPPAPAGPKPKTREELVEDYRKELAKTPWKREQRRELVRQFRKALMKKGVA